MCGREGEACPNCRAAITRIVQGGRSTFYCGKCQRYTASGVDRQVERMNIVAAMLILVLFLLAGLHLYWGLGGTWPGHDADSLRLRVVGTQAGSMPGFAPCAAVATALIAAAVIIFFGQGRITFGIPSLIVYGGYAALILVFGLRGLAPYLTGAFGYARGTPFFDLNRQYYAPLCLFIAGGLALNYPPGLGRAIARLVG